jgi:hypothetical protein
MTPSVLADPYGRWASEELHSSNPANALPTRFNDEDGGDPYSTILFQDIRSFLQDLRTTEAKELFRLIWLVFLGVHIPGLSSVLQDGSAPNIDDRWSATHFATAEFLSSLFPSDVDTPAITADAHAGVLLGRERQYSNIFGPVKHWGFDMLSPLEGIGSDKYTMITRMDLAGANVAVIRHVFQQCRLSTADREWGALCLAFEAAIEPKR